MNIGSVKSIGAGTAPDFCSLLEAGLLPAPDDYEYTVFPGFCDVHVHFREPGFSYKETIRTGSRAAARGGYTAVCAMPNLRPVPDSAGNLARQTEIIAADAVVRVFPYGAISVGQEGRTLADMDALADRVAAFSDDGRGVQSEELMESAMRKAAALGKIIAAHCEADSLLDGGYIHAGRYAREHGHRGIRSESEWRQVERDLVLAKKTGCKYHVCHVSCRESVELIRRAKAEGVDVSCETAPHYLLLDENDLREDGRFKMNPPLRAREDRLSLIEGIQDGTIDMIATDHAPHSAEEKAGGLRDSAFGIVGLETAFPLLYTGLVQKNVISLQRLVELMAVNPRQRFHIPLGGDCTVWELDRPTRVESAAFLSMGRATPFDGAEIRGSCRLTVAAGKVAYDAGLSK